VNARSVLAVAITAVLLGAATAKAADYRSYSLTTQPKVAEAADATAFLRARFILPADWTRLSAPKGTLRFREGHRSCFYTVSIALRAHVAPTASLQDHLAADLPVPAAAYVLDAGERSPGAWRVTRLRTTNQQVRLSGAYARPMTTDPNLVPDGQSAWGEIVASAASRKGDECHSGTYRQTLGPALGDAFATARMTAYLRSR
jgi:hypothetical protein